MPYGTGTYGGGSPFGGAGALSIANAWAASTHSVHVELTTPARAVDAFDIGDALNPNTWTIERLDTAVMFTVIGASPVDDGTLMHWEITVLEPLASAAVMHRISSDVLLDAAGVPIVSPRSADFPGVVDAFAPLPGVARRSRWRDVSNPPFIASTSGHLPGTIAVGSDGDYKTDEGEALASKMVIRRITTPKGSIKHLPRFGVGIRVKEPLPMAGDLSKLRKEIEDQVLEEPDIAATRCELDIIADNAILIRVRSRLKSGVTFSVGVRRNSDGRFVEFT